MSLPTTVLIQIDAKIAFRGITLRGDVLHVPESRQLVIAGDEEEEVLTIEAPESEKARGKAAGSGIDLRRLVTIKDYSEHSGLASALQEAGLVRIVDRFTKGPWSSPVVVAEVLAPQRLYTVQHLSASAEAVLRDQLKRFDEVLADPEWEWGEMVEAALEVRDGLEKLLQGAVASVPPY